jgi:hypothetical protein
MYLDRAGYIPGPHSRKLGLKDVVMNGSHGPVFPPKSKLLQRRNPLAMKTAAKKTVKPPPEFIKDFKEVQNTLEKLELNLKKIKRDLGGLCQNPQIPAPPPPKK